MNIVEPITFLYDVKQKRNYSGSKEAIARYKEFKRRRGEKLQFKSNGNVRDSEIHHIDHCRSNGHKNNLFICESSEQHTNFHLQTTQFIVECIQSGLLGFDWLAKKYFVAFQPMNDWIRAWREAGKPNWHHNKNLDMSKLYRRMHNYVAGMDKQA